MRKTILIIGSSRGIGAEVVQHFTNAGHKVIGVSRTQSENCEWIEADVSTSEGIVKVAEALSDKPIDALIYSSGVWEEKGFMQDFDFLQTTYDETAHIMSVNVVAPIEITKVLANNLSLTNNPKAIYLGALSGVDNITSEQVAYSASKFGLRGAIQSLRAALKSNEIGFTVINPGNVATDEVLEDIAAERFVRQTPIPISDVIASIEFVLSTSNSVKVGDINLMQKHD
jgi:short-subunit dehydrogenase